MDLILIRLKYKQELSIWDGGRCTKSYQALAVGSLCVTVQADQEI